jgi:hypothetical protein
MQVERAERAAIHLFVAGVGVAMMGVAGPFAFDVPKIFWQIIVLAGALLTFLSGAFLIYEYRDLVKRGRMIPVIGMIISGVLFVAFAGWHFWPSQPEPKTAEIPTQQFSWNWEPLSIEQISGLHKAIESLDKQPIQIACISDTCGALSASLHQLFEELHWPIINSNSSQDSRYAQGITGITINRTDRTAELIQNSIQTRTELPIRMSPTARPGAPLVDHILLIIGAKPLPAPLPDEVRKELVDLASQLKRVSSEILEFANDRQREEARLPVLGTSPGDHSYEEFRRRVAFGNETQALMQRKFGAEAAASLAILGRLGIYPAFLVQNSDREPARWGKWFGTVGNFLEQTKIAEARAIASDDSFWFHQ